MGGGIASPWESSVGARCFSCVGGVFLRGDGRRGFVFRCFRGRFGSGIWKLQERTQFGVKWFVWRMGFDYFRDFAGLGAFGLEIGELLQGGIEASADGVEGHDCAADFCGFGEEDFTERAGVAGGEAVFPDGGIDAGVAAAEPFEADERVDEGEFFGGGRGEAGVEGGGEFGVVSRVFEADDFGFGVDAGFYGVLGGFAFTFGGFRAGGFFGVDAVGADLVFGGHVGF